MRFVDIAGTWFGLNEAVALLLATLDAGCGVDRCQKRFREYRSLPGCIQKAFRRLFFTPASVIIALTGLGLLNDASWASALAAQALPGIAGMQLKELLLFRSDWMMTAHHNLTALLSAIIWAGCREHPEDIVRCFFGFFRLPRHGGRERRLRRLDRERRWGAWRPCSAILMTGCHLLILPLYGTYLLAGFAGFDGGQLLCLLVALVTVGTAPRRGRGRRSCRRTAAGLASGVFVEEGPKKLRRSPGAISTTSCLHG